MVEVAPDNFIHGQAPLIGLCEQARFKVRRKFKSDRHSGPSPIVQVPPVTAGLYAGRHHIPVLCLLSGRRYLMARKAGQLIARGPRTWLVRVSLGRDRETGTRKYYNKTVRGSFREAQAYLKQSYRSSTAEICRVLPPSDWITIW